MEDYQANSNVSKKKILDSVEAEEKKEKKEIVKAKAVTGEVVSVPPSMGKKLKSIFFGADLKRVGQFVTSEVLLPALRNMIYDTGKAALGQAIFGESPSQQRYRPRGPDDYRSKVNYQTPVHRGMWEQEQQDRAMLSAKPTRIAKVQYPVEDFAFETREDANIVIEIMLECIDKYEEVSVANYYETMGRPSNPIDYKWGWTYLADTEVRQTRHGFVIDLPKPEPL